MDDKPAQSNGRDAFGQFLPGHKGGPGNPHSKRCNQLRTKMIETITTDDIEEITRQLIALAKKGNIKAIKEVFDRVMGKAIQQINVADAEGNSLQTSVDILRSEFMKSLTQESGTLNENKPGG